jgi:uncharacterized protein DUF1236
MKINRTSIATSVAALGVAVMVEFIQRASAQPTLQVPLTSEQRELIRAHIVQERRLSVSTPVELFPALGAEVPKNIEVFWMPPSAGLNRYRYAVVNQRAVVLDYEGRRVIEMLEPVLR